MVAEKNLTPEIEDVETDNTASNETEVSSELSSTNASQISSADEHGNRKFDTEKVERIKAQLAFGVYEINPTSIVSKMIGDRT